VFKRATPAMRFSRTVMRVTLTRLVLCLGCVLEVLNAFNRTSLKSSEPKMTGDDPKIA
jgi:hypothetical protein